MRTQIRCSSHRFHPTGHIVCFIWINSTNAFCTRFRMIDNLESLKSHRNYYSVQQPNFLRHVNYMDKFTSSPHTHTRQRRQYVCTAHAKHFIGSTLRDARPLQMSSTPQTDTETENERGRECGIYTGGVLFVAWPMCSVRHLIWL